MTVAGRHRVPVYWWALAWIALLAVCAGLAFYGAILVFRP